MAKTLGTARGRQMMGLLVLLAMMRHRILDGHIPGRSRKVLPRDSSLSHFGNLMGTRYWEKQYDADI